MRCANLSSGWRIAAEGIPELAFVEKKKRTEKLGITPMPTIVSAGRCVLAIGWHVMASHPCGEGRNYVTYRSRGKQPKDASSSHSNVVQMVLKDAGTALNTRAQA